MLSGPFRAIQSFTSSEEIVIAHAKSIAIFLKSGIPHCIVMSVVGNKIHFDEAEDKFSTLRTKTKLFFISKVMTVLKHSPAGPRSELEGGSLYVKKLHFREGAYYY